MKNIAKLVLIAVLCMTALLAAVSCGQDKKDPQTDTEVTTVTAGPATTVTDPTTEAPPDTKTQEPEKPVEPPFTFEEEGDKWSKDY